MNQHYRVALLGFSDFERKTLASYFRLASTRSPRYDHVQMLTDADYLVADADHAPSVQLVLATERLAETVFIGTQSPAGSIAWMTRPIDALHVMRELDAMVAQAHGRQSPVPAPQQMPWRMPELAPDGASARAPTMLPTASAASKPPTLRDEDVSPLWPLGAVVPELEASVPPPLAPESPPIHLLPEPLPVLRRAASEAAPAQTLPVPVPLSPPSPPSLPPSPQPPQPKIIQPPVAGAPALPPAPRALLVDDSEIALRFLESRLKRYGLQIDRALASGAAIELLESRPYDYVFLDVELGPESELDGLALCQHIKHSAAGVTTTVILVSAHHSELDRVRGALAGCDAYLGKPLDAAELDRLLERQGVQGASGGTRVRQKAPRPRVERG
jgi:CheY-like chemotaxis protein